MLKEIATDAAPKPFSNYAQGIETPPGARMLFIAGQVGADPSGRISEVLRRGMSLFSLISTCVDSIIRAIRAAP